MTHAALIQSKFTQTYAGIIMKLSIYIKNYLLNDLILLVIIAGTTYLLVNTLQEAEPEETTTVELLPFNEAVDDEIG